MLFEKQRSRLDLRYSLVTTVNNLASLSTHAPVVDSLSCAYGSKQDVPNETVAEKHGCQDTDQWNALDEGLNYCHC